MKYTTLLIIFATALLSLTPGCDRPVAPTRAPRLICFAVDSHDLLPKVGEIAKAITETSVLPGDRFVILDSTRTKLVDCSVRKPEFLEPLSDVQRRYARELDQAMASIKKVEAAQSVPAQMAQGHLLLHVQREFGSLPSFDKLLIIVSKGFDIFPSVSSEELAIYGPEEAIEDLTNQGLVPDLEGFRVLRTGPASPDVNANRLYDRFWSSLLQHAHAKDFRLIGWESVTSEITETIQPKADL